MVYYGAAGHGKGLVDAMSGFGVKGPLRKAVVTENLSYSSSEEIHSYLQQLFQIDDKKHYYLLSESETEEKRKTKAPLVVQGCQKFHMIAFHPNGSVQTKLNMCLCDDCFKGNFIDCLLEPGNMLSRGQLGVDESNSESDEEFEYEMML